MPSETVSCCIAGGGPAGAMLGLVLARAGVDVLVLEKHGDFLRDFRGDTIHPSTMRLMDQLGFGDEFMALPHRRSETAAVVTNDDTFQLADFRRVPGRHRYLAFMPQWDFLDFLTQKASAWPGFRLCMRAEVIDLLRENDRYTGVRYRDAEGAEHRVQARLTVAADGRDSDVRKAAGLRSVRYGAPMDVLWFRMSRRPSDPHNVFGRLARGRLLVMIDRGEHWQIGFIIPKDGLEPLRRRGLDGFQQEIATLAPFLADRVGEVTSWDDVKLLRVQVDRLRRWWRPGLLCIGDAAHAMSPVGGVGINLAIQDAVAAANLLGPRLRAGTLRDHHLAQVQVRRILPTVVTQTVQRVVQRQFLAQVVAGRAGGTAPAPLRVVSRFSLLQAIAAYAVGYGLLPQRIKPPARSSR